MPLLAALLLGVLSRQQAESSPSWSLLLHNLALGTLIGLPMLAAHLAACRLRLLAGFGVWLAGFAIYPAMVLKLAGPALTLRDLILAAAFSALFVLFGPVDRDKGGAAAFRPTLGRIPLTLDGAVIALLSLWALFATSLFASTPDAVNNQPLKVWLDAARIATHPAETLGYLWQFAVIAALLFGYYWGCRHILVLNVLRRQGWVAFALASLVYWIVSTSVVSSVVLTLPLNPPDWSLLPSADHNPFAPDNFGFGLVIWAMTIPIVLASELLVAQRGEAIVQREQARAELHMLQQQINPHFLFNTLNTLYALCLRSHTASAEAVVKLADLLRYTVHSGQREWVGLDEEVTYLRNYLDLQMLRFGEKCRLQCSWPDNAESFQIPPLLLIMLVENAFKHGIEPSGQPGEVSIVLALANSRMDFSCVSSIASDEAAPQPSGLGLANLRRRLELQFGDSFVLASARQGELWHASLELDLRQC